MPRRPFGGGHRGRVWIGTEDEGVLDAEATDCALASTGWEEYCCVEKVDEWSGTVKCTLSGDAEQENIDEDLETVWDVGDPFTIEGTRESSDETVLYLDLGLESGTTANEYTANVKFKGYYKSVKKKNLVCDGKIEVKVTVVDVESILPDIGQEVDDGDGNDSTKVFVVSVTNTNDVIVTATLDPAVAESDLPSGWTINGGSGSKKLERTVNTASSSKTIFTFSIGGSDSGLETTLYVYSAKLGLYADEGNVDADEYGHSWWEFSADSNIEDLARSLNADVDGHKYFGVAGWWPNTQHPGAEAPGVVRFGTIGSGGHTVTGSKEWNIDFNNLVNGVKYVHNLENSGKNWTVLWDNCTDEAIIVGNESGVSTISYHGITSPEELSDWLNSGLPQNLWVKSPSILHAISFRSRFISA